MGKEFKKPLDLYCIYLLYLIEMRKETKIMTLVNLESVGNVIDENGVTYPMLVDGGYDIFGGIHVNDIENDEFFDALSTEDWDVIQPYLNWVDTEADYLEMKAELAYGI